MLASRSPAARIKGEVRAGVCYVPVALRLNKIQEVTQDDCASGADRYVELFDGVCRVPFAIRQGY